MFRLISAAAAMLVLAACGGGAPSEAEIAQALKDKFAAETKASVDMATNLAGSKYAAAAIKSSGLDKVPPVENLKVVDVEETSEGAYNVKASFDTEQQSFLGTQRANVVVLMTLVEEDEGWRVLEWSPVGGSAISGAAPVTKESAPTFVAKRSGPPKEAEVIEALQRKLRDQFAEQGRASGASTAQIQKVLADVEVVIEDFESTSTEQNDNGDYEVDSSFTMTVRHAGKGQSETVETQLTLRDKNGMWEVVSLE